MDMKDHNKKMIAPVIITILFLVYVIVYAVIVLSASEWSPLFLLLIIPLAMLGGGMVCTLIARIREIRSGEEDDLSDY